jgi:tetratricopeptide (TPR) repeat protein
LPGVGTLPGVGALPRVPPWSEEFRALDKQIELDGATPRAGVKWLLERASVRGRLEDYTAALALSERWVAEQPTSPEAWKARVQALSRVHRFAAAREALVHLSADDAAPLAATIDEAVGDIEAAGAYRERMAKESPSVESLTLWAAHLAMAGRTDEALAVMPRAAAMLRGPSADGEGWFLFQWGRIYEQAGRLAEARDFFAAAYARFPSLETTVHLAQATAATGGDPHAIVAEALARDPSPELYALAGDTPAARREWERYLAALPEAFADHAARFYLTVDPARAVALADQNLANRQTREARALVIEAALAAAQPERACSQAGMIIHGSRNDQFLAWRAFTACGRTADAAALAQSLGLR